MYLSVKISIGKISFDSINRVDISSTWRRFTQTARVWLPKAMYYQKEGKRHPVKNIRDFIKVGDRVKIELGYNGMLVTEFEGYVAYSPKLTIPYEIECEDEMWKLKQKEVNVSMGDASVKEIIQAVAPGYAIECADEYYGDFSLLKTTPVKVFDELKQTSGIHTFFRGNRLIVGKPYSDPEIDKTVKKYVFGHNILNNTLTYRDSEEVNVKVYGSSLQADGTIIRAEAGNDGGNVIRREIPGRTKEQLDKDVELIQEEERNFSRYVGTITSFGFPFVKHGMVVNVVDDLYEKGRDTKHYIEEVNVWCSPEEGYRRMVKLGRDA